MAARRSLDSGRAEYESRLSELFEESDVTDKGFLNVEEVNALCSRLQLGRLKDKVVRSLQERTEDKEKVYYEDFRNVFFSLLEDLEAQQNKSPGKIPLKDAEEPEKSPKVTPKLVIGRKKYGRRSLPFSRDAEMKSQAAPDCSYSQFLQDLDTNDRSSPSVEVEGKHVKRRRHARSSDFPGLAATRDKAKEETYEAEGQLPTDEDHGLETDSGMRQLQDVCHQLGVGASGTLNQTEFGSVCAYIGMGSIKERELAELFSRMDSDRDGLISLSELISGLPQTSTLHSSSSSRLRSSSRSLSGTPRSRSHSRTRGEERMGASRNNTPAQFISGDFTGLFSSIENSHDGFAKSEDVIDFWDGIGVTNGADILLSLGFNPHGKVKLPDLTTALVQELSNPSSPENVHHAALTTYQQEVRHLKSVVDQSKDKNKKLKLDLSESNARNALLAREVDDRHAQLDKSWELKLVTVDQKYQEQVKALQTELDREREAGAAQASRLRQQLEEMQSRSSQEEQRLAEKVAVSQREAARVEKELHESLEKIKALNKQNDQLKKDMHHKLQLAEKSRIVEENNQKLVAQEKQLERKQEENKQLKDENDELLAQLEDARQKLQAVQKHGASPVRPETPPGHSRIPVMKGSDIAMRHRLSVSSFEASETEDEETASIASARGFKPQSHRKRQKLTGSTQSLEADYNEVPSLSKELSQQQTEELLERERKDMEQRYKMEITALEERHDAEKSKILNSFDQEKEWLMEEQKIKEEMMMAEQLKELQTEFAREKQDLVQKHESEKNYIQHRHDGEMKAIQQRLLETESHIEGSEKMEHLVQNLEAQLAKCHDDLRQLEGQKSDLGVQLRQQEVALREEFEEERRNLAERFSREFEQRQMSHRHQMEQIFVRGAEGLTGKLRDDFLSLVRKHTEEEVGRSQAAILNQLQYDRSGIAAALEKEKTQIYEEAESQKLALAEKYESQITALRIDLNQLRAQLEAAKRVSAKAAQMASDSKEDATHDAVQNLRREMEEEMVIELAKMKESFESEKKELETQKTLLEEELSELQGLLEAERKKTAEMENLKETMKILKSEKKEVEGMVEGMKEKLFQAYRQKEVEQTDFETQLEAVRVEGLNKGKDEGHREGKEQGKNEGWKEGYDEGYTLGQKNGLEEGLRKNREQAEASEAKFREEMKSLVDSLRQEKSTLENRLRQEKDRSNKIVQQAQDRDQLKTSFDLLLGEKHALEAKFQESYNAVLEEHQAEKEHLMEEIRRLEAQRLHVQSDKKAMEAHIGAVHQELQVAKQALNEDISQTEDESGFDLSQGQGALQEQMTLLSHQLKEAQTAQEELGLLKGEYETLLQEKTELEETVRKLRAKASEDDHVKIRSQMAQIKNLNLEKQKIQTLLDQTSDQLVKASTSMALAQSKFVRELEIMKQKAKSMVEVESYTQLQISLVEHQRLVITLQDAIRERESLVDKVIKEGDDEVQRIRQVMEAKVKDIQSRLDFTQEQLLKQKEKFKQMSSTGNRRNLVLKDLYVENAELMKTLADSEEKRRQSERLGRKLTGKFETYKKTVDRLCHSLSR